jgi:hypothetical protein
MLTRSLKLVTFFRLFRLLFFFLFIIPSSLLAQIPAENNSSPVRWQKSATVNGVSFYYAPADCNGAKKILLKMVNANPYEVNVGWQPAFPGVAEQKINDVLSKKMITLPANATMIGSCESNSTAQLQIDLVKAVPTHAVDPQSFVFQQLSVVRSSSH